MANEKDITGKRFQKLLAREFLAAAILDKVRRVTESFPDEVKNDPVEFKLKGLLAAINILIDFMSDMEFDLFGPCPGLEEVASLLKVGTEGPSTTETTEPSKPNPNAN